MTLFLTLALALFVVGCGSRQPTAKPAPAVFRPFEFRDIPIPPGFRPDETADQLASSLAGGAIRTYNAVYIRKKAMKQADAPSALQWYAEALPSHGWVTDKSASGDTAAYLKHGSNGQTERLLLQTGRRSGDDIVRLSLAAQSR